MGKQLTRQYIQRIGAGLVMTALLLGSSALFNIHDYASAQSAVAPEQVQEISQSINTVQSEIQKIEAEINEYKAEVAEIDQEQDSLTKKLKQIESERNQLSSEVQLTEKEIERTQLTLQEIKNGLTFIERSVERQRDAIAQTFRTISAMDDITLAEIMFSDESLGTSFQRYSDLGITREALIQRIESLRTVRADLNKQKKEFVTEEQELAELKDKILSQRKIQDQEKIAQQGLLRETQYEEDKYQDLIAEREALRKAYEKELYEYESKLKFLFDPTALPAKGSAPLSWPLDQVLVTQMFGAISGPHRIYKDGIGHSGADFRARTPVEVYAAADGIIQGVGNTDDACRGASYGKWVLVNHDNNLATISAHLSIISVSEGQRVTRGQIIGWSGNTGRSTAPHLHFGVLAGIDAQGQNPVEVKGKASNACAGKTLVQPRAAHSAYLDPLDYLPPTTNANFKAGISR